MEILADAGVRFNSSEVLEIFRRHGFRIDGKQVFITEKEIRNSLETAPSHFTVRARKPAYDVSIGEDDFVFLPTGGAPNVVTAAGELRPATLEDYHTCCRMVQTSDQLDMNGMLTVQPTDLPAQTAHLDMIYANMVLCDKAYVGAAMSRQAAIDCLEMAAIAWMDINVNSIDVDTIKSLGSDGNYLIHDTTFNHCRKLYQPKLFTCDDYHKWREHGAKMVSVVAAEMLPKRWQNIKNRQSMKD
jgi:trimethylamine--corrinoid protein Co-methyltransferase